MTGYNLGLDLVNINSRTKFGKIQSMNSCNIERKQNLTSIKGHNTVTNKRKIMMHNNLNLDHANIIAYTIFGKILLICS